MTAREWLVDQVSKERLAYDQAKQIADGDSREDFRARMEAYRRRLEAAEEALRIFERGEKAPA